MDLVFFVDRISVFLKSGFIKLKNKMI